jgi:hypothetical protein
MQKPKVQQYVIYPQHNTQNIDAGHATHMQGSADVVFTLWLSTYVQTNDTRLPNHETGGQLASE